MERWGLFQDGMTIFSVMFCMQGVRMWKHCLIDRYVPWHLHGNYSDQGTTMSGVPLLPKGLSNMYLRVCECMCGRISSLSTSEKVAPPDLRLEKQIWQRCFMFNAKVNAIKIIFQTCLIVLSLPRHHYLVDKSASVLPDEWVHPIEIICFLCNHKD